MVQKKGEGGNYIITPAVGGGMYIAIPQDPTVTVDMQVSSTGKNKNQQL